MKHESAVEFETKSRIHMGLGVESLERSLTFYRTLFGQEPTKTRLAQEAYAFFKRSCDDADQETGRIARQWLDGLPRDAPWIAAELPPAEKRAVRLIHTYGGSLWDRFSQLLDGDAPKRFLVISPFFDQEADLAQRLRQRWPKRGTRTILLKRSTTSWIVTRNSASAGMLSVAGWAKA